LLAGLVSLLALTVGFTSLSGGITPIGFPDLPGLVGFIALPGSAQLLRHLHELALSLKQLKSHLHPASPLFHNFFPEFFE
jgi:hypothetical protein